MHGTSVMSSSQEALFGPNAQRLELSLLGARTAAVLRRVATGSRLDGYDESSLSAAIEALIATADAMDFVAGGGQLRAGRRTVGFGAMAFAVETATPSVPPADVPKYLRDVAEELRQLGEHPDVKAAERLLPTFSMLADIAMRQAGSVGEGSGSTI